MQFKTLLGAAVLLTPTWAIRFTNFPFPTNIPAGQPITLTWDGATSGPVTITLRQGNPGNLNTVAVITSSATGGSYTWTPSAAQIPAVENTNFALELSQGSDNNYSQQFSVTGGTAAALPSASGSVSASISSAISSISASASSRASALISSASSVAANATMTRSSSMTSSTASRTASATTAATSAPANTGNNLKSPVALILGAFAAIVYLS